MDVAGVVAWSAGMLNGAEWKRLAQEKKLKVVARMRSVYFVEALVCHMYCYSCFYIFVRVVVVGFVVFVVVCL
jgi:hypothetical protein